MIAVEHMRATFQKCRRPLPDRIGCGGFVYWEEADYGKQKELGLEGTCTHCGTLWYTGCLLGTCRCASHDNPKPVVERHRGHRGHRFTDGVSVGRWTRMARLKSA